MDAEHEALLEAREILNGMFGEPTDHIEQISDYGRGMFIPEQMILEARSTLAKINKALEDEE